ncbi:LPXTG cell wall anchor domain-containing protein [Paeniclostridium hominis]
MTGDKGMLIYISIGVVSLAGLYINMKKRKK